VITTFVALVAVAVKAAEDPGEIELGFAFRFTVAMGAATVTIVEAVAELPAALVARAV